LFGHLISFSLESNERKLAPLIYFRLIVQGGKVEAPIANHLSNFEANREHYEVVEIFPKQEDRFYGDSNIFIIIFLKLKLLRNLGAKECNSPIAMSRVFQF